MTGRNLKSSLALIGTLALGAACQSPSAPAPAPTPSDVAPVTTAVRPLTAGPARDVASNVPATKLAFTGQHGTFRAGYQTHAVAIADGVIDLTPSSWDPATNKRITGGTVGFETLAVTRGDDTIAAGVATTAQTDVNVVEVPRGPVTERITNREDGVEQEWQFAAAPDAVGDLTVAVSVVGARMDLADANGLHFRSATGLGFLYGNGVWRDSAGGEWEIPARYEDGRIVLTVPESVVDGSTFPAVLDPTISAELFTNLPAIGTTGANSRNMDVASNGAQYFVVWQDQRDGTNDDIYGSSLTAAGAIVDTKGVKINTAAGVQQNPTVAYVGNGYVVAWENVVAAGNSDIVAAFVSPTNVVTPLGTIAGTAANETVPTLIGHGSDALLVWQDGANVLAARYTGGAFGAPFNVAAGANVEKEPGGAAIPTGDYLVTFTETVAAGNDDIRGQLVTAAGALDGAVFNIANQTGSQNTSVAGYDGTNFVVAWTTGGNIQGARVGPTGTLLDTTPVAINSGTGSQINPDISCTTGSCFVAWEDTRTFATTSRDVFGALLTTATALTITTNDIAITTAPRTQVGPAIDIAGGQWLVAWSDNRDLDTTSIRASRVSSAGAVLDASGLTVVTNNSRYGAPAIAQSSTYTDLVWSDSQIPDANIVHARFTSKMIDTTPKVVTSATASQATPTAAFVGANFLAAWTDSRGADRDVYMATIDQTTGTAGTSTAVTSATLDQIVPKMASGGASALVVWQDRRNGATTGFDIYGALVTSAGAVSVADISICQGTGDQTRPSVAYDSVHNVYLVVWADPSAGTNDIRAARVSAAGALLDASCGVAVSTAANAQLSPDVTFGNGQFFVVWDDRRNDALGDVFGARVTANGSIAVLDPNGISIAAVAGSRQTEPAVAWGGAYAGSYLVVWSDQRNQATTLTDVWGVQVSTTGTVDTPFVITASNFDEHAPDVSAGAAAASPFNVTYIVTRPDLDTDRAQLRRITLSTTGGQPCSSNSQCSSGFCSDSVCCNTACGGLYNQTDCQACSVTRGAQVDGTCSNILASAHYICRYYSETPVQCDVAEVCNGVSPDCPPDLGQKQGQACTVYATSMPGTCPANDVTGAPHKCI